MEEETPKKSYWKRFTETISSPASALSDATKHSPVITIFAILLIIQPVIQTGIEFVKGLAEVKQNLNPQTRPVTKAELDLVNQKIDFNNQLILADIQADKDKEKSLNAHPRGVDKDGRVLDGKRYRALQDKLAGVQKNLDSDYSGHKK